ncbi:MAG: PQQ-binding-like beta-propeller repeat protein [Bacteroidetes bacterium]|nr:PQQ-binding-like beta-propeller repeat protein [Bacteroidota bacterium]
MKKSLHTYLFLLLLLAFSGFLHAQGSTKSSQGWGIVASYTIPGKASGLAWDGTYIYFGIYGVNGSKIYKFNPSTGNNSLQCTGAFEDAFGLTYKSPDLITVNQPSNSNDPSELLEFSMSGSTVTTLTLPDHYMSGCAWDNGSWWVCTYYPDPGTVYNVSTSGTVISQFTPPANQPWDICKQGNDLWIADYNSNNLYKVTTSGSLIETHASAGGKPSGVVFDGTYLWYCDGELGSNSTLYKVDLSASGTAVINVPVTSHNYGSVAIGSSSTWNCQVQNTGTANLTINSLSIPSGQPISSPLSFPQTITPGNTLSIPIKYMPAAATALNTQVVIHSSDPVTPAVNVTLTGMGVYSGAHIDLTYSSHTWGTRRAGAYSRWYLPVTNDGSQNLIISSLSINDQHFILDDSINLPITISSLHTAMLGVWFHPTETNSYSGSLIIGSNSVGGGSDIIDLAGSGLQTDYPLGTELWRYKISGGFDNSPKSIMPLADITGDGVVDVIVGSEDDFVRCFNGNASVDGDVLWSHEISGGSVYNQNSICTIDDINLDGYRDVIIGTAWGDRSIVALSGKTGQQLWKHDTHEYGDGGWVYQVDSKYDYNSDGFPDVVAATGDDGNGTGPKRVYCLNGRTGNVIWQKSIGGPVFSVIEVEDITGDGKPDVVAGASNAQETIGKALALDGTNGTIKWSYNTPGSSVWGLLQLDDINGDGKKDIAVGDFDGTVTILNAANGAKIHELGLGAVSIVRFQDIGDMNKNGFRDILVAHSGSDGIIIDGKDCNKIWDQPLADDSWCVANIHDITFDGYNDVIIGTLYTNNYSYFLDGTNGNILGSYPTADAVDAINAIPDIVGDSTMEMLVGDRQGLLICRSGGYDTTTMPPVGISHSLANDLSASVFPNPSDGKFQLKVSANAETEANIRIIDLQGQTLTKIEESLHYGDNLIPIDLSNRVMKGAYFLQINARNRSSWHKIIIK